jgi:hypothetical protein
MTSDMPERRENKRNELSCPVTLTNGHSEVTATAKSLNISDGGALIKLPADSVPSFGSELIIKLSVPRKTANTYMPEEFVCNGRVVRHQPLEDDRWIGVALQFGRPLRLELDA